MKCEKCQDRGFIEFEHGLVMKLCDCDKAREVAERNGIPWRENEKPKALILSERMGNGETLKELEIKAHKIIEACNDSSSRIGQVDSDIGSGDTSEPKLIKKQRTKKKARKRTG